MIPGFYFSVPYSVFGVIGQISNQSLDKTCFTSTFLNVWCFAAFSTASLIPGKKSTVYVMFHVLVFFSS